LGRPWKINGFANGNENYWYKKVLRCFANGLEHPDQKLVETGRGKLQYPSPDPSTAFFSTSGRPAQGAAYFASASHFADQLELIPTLLILHLYEINHPQEKRRPPIIKRSPLGVQ
jgi:hypothetical protein